MTAGTDDPGDSYQNCYRFTGDEVDDVTIVISVDATITPPPAYGTYLLFRTESLNK